MSICVESNPIATANVTIGTVVRTILFVTLNTYTSVSEIASAMADEIMITGYEIQNEPLLER